jgi:hypothetical protein
MLPWNRAIVFYPGPEPYCSKIQSHGTLPSEMVF